MKKLFVGVLWVALSLSVQGKEVNMTSPDGKYQFTLSDSGGQLHYSLTWNGKQTVKPSLLGINANVEWRDGVEIGTVDSSRKDTIWHPVYGERSEIKDCYNAWKILVNRQNGRDKLILDIRAYDEGIAFRYHFPGGQYLKITDEYTEYTMPEGTKAYFTPKAQTPYSYLPLENWPGESDRPLLLTLAGGGYVCLAEAQVVDYVRTKFNVSSTKKNTIISAMYGPVEDIAPYSTPWRVIMCADKPGEILEHNDILLNLNPPCRIKDTSWIKPGKVFRAGDLKQDKVKVAVDFAAERGIRYVHMDAGWYGPEMKMSSDATTVSSDKDLDIPALCKYAESKGIGLMVYVNQRALVQQLDILLPLYKKWGLKGIKFGFVQIGNQRWSTWLHDAVRKCGEYNLMVDIHDEYRPTGFSRTYPNLMTQEGIRGNEEMPDATHNMTLPFTRYLAGAGDYTLCYFNNRVKNTKAHQLAMAAVYYSPLQFMFWYDRPEFYQGEEELEFWKAIPSVWDDSRALDGEIGEYIVQARRSGNDWFVGAMTNTEARTITLTTDFLEPGKKYMLHLYEDDDKLNTRTKVRSTHKKIKAGDKLVLKLKASGGAALHFTPLKK